MERAKERQSGHPQQMQIGINFVTTKTKENGPKGEKGKRKGEKAGLPFFETKFLCWWKRFRGIGVLFQIR